LVGSIAKGFWGFKCLWKILAKFADRKAICKYLTVFCFLLPGMQLEQLKALRVLEKKLKW